MLIGWSYVHVTWLYSFLVTRMVGRQGTCASQNDVKNSRCIWPRVLDNEYGRSEILWQRANKYLECLDATGRSTDDDNIFLGHRKLRDGDCSLRDLRESEGKCESTYNTFGQIVIALGETLGLVVYLASNPVEQT